MTTDKVDTQVVIDIFDNFAKQIKKTTICVLDNVSKCLTKINDIKVGLKIAV
jgi:hypothetical protein